MDILSGKGSPMNITSHSLSDPRFRFLMRANLNGNFLAIMTGRLSEPFTAGPGHVRQFGAVRPGFIAGTLPNPPRWRFSSPAGAGFTCGCRIEDEGLGW